MNNGEIKYQGISTLEILIEAKNYNKWIADEIKNHISSPTLEVGAGTGNLTTYFINNNLLHITEKDEGLVKYLKDKFKKYKQLVIKELDIAKLPPKEMIGSFSSIFAVNVLEHIEDDEKALKNLSGLLQPNGKLILLVPAKKFAYTRLDKELGHFRRYEKHELTEKLSKCGYAIDKVYFFNIVGLLSWIVRDKVSRRNIYLKPYHIKFFDSVVPLLRIFESIIKVPVGISLIVVARKVN